MHLLLEILWTKDIFNDWIECFKTYLRINVTKKRVARECVCNFDTSHSFMGQNYNYKEIHSKSFPFLFKFVNYLTHMTHSKTIVLAHVIWCHLFGMVLVICILWSLTTLLGRLAIILCFIVWMNNGSHSPLLTTSKYLRIWSSLFFFCFFFQYFQFYWSREMVSFSFDLAKLS
jgi:hypothetical protein